MEARPAGALPPVDVVLGEQGQVQPVCGASGRVLVEKAGVSEITTEITLCEDVEAPVEKGQKLGEMTVKRGEQELARVPLVAGEAVERLRIPGIFARLARRLFLGG